MNNKFSLRYSVKRVAALCLALLTFTGCTLKTIVAEPSKTVGVGRAAENITSEPERVEVTPDGVLPVVDEQPPLTGNDTPSSGNGTVSWSFKNGTYSYTFPEPDRSTLSDLTDVNNTSRAFFDDINPNDPGGTWYFAPTSVDPATGEIVFTWGKDRSESTLAALANYGGIYRGDTSRKVCYLTFDCGYENGYTEKIIDTLNAKGVSGTFFITGDYVEQAPGIIGRMLDEGHILGNHTVNHINMALTDTQTFIDEITGLEKMVKEIYPDSQPIRYYRPPEGATSEWALKMADKLGVRTTLWSYTYKDYDPNNQLDHSTALQNLKGGLHPGCVYLLHAVSSTNAAVLGDLIDWIKAQGYEILPLCDIDISEANAEAQNNG
ncbi:MAG: polysaccharide deacetylase family protein [Clostridia bacterium]|nr:polysaccharide deacetylase family protein [Clostridia bacterium]